MILGNSLSCKALFLQIEIVCRLVFKFTVLKSMKKHETGLVTVSYILVSGFETI